MRWGGIACGVLALPVLFPASAQTAAPKIPDFSEDATVGWLAAGNEYIPMETGPHPVRPDPAHPYIQNPFRGRQPTLRVADLDNPILQPWVKESLAKVNERVLAGKPAFPPQVRCWPLGVPAFVLYTAQPIYIIQRPAEVLMIWQSDQMVRQIYRRIEVGPMAESTCAEGNFNYFGFDWDPLPTAGKADF